MSQLINPELIDNLKPFFVSRNEWYSTVLSSGSGTITGVTAGAGLTGGGTTGTVTLDVGAGDGISVAADAVAVSLAATSGLNFSTGALLIGAGDGIDVLTNTIAVDVTDFIDTSYGLTENTNDIRINLASPSGLGFAGGALAIADTIAGNGLEISSKVMAVGVGNGLARDANTVYIDLATTSGLNFSTGNLLVGAGDGIDVLTNTVAVDVTDIIDTNYGLTENTNDIRINLASPSGLSFSTGALQIDDSIAGTGLTITNKVLDVDAGSIDHSGLAGDGLTWDGVNSELDVNVGDGLDIVTDAVAVDVTDFIDTNYGLTENTNDIRINLAATSGLNFSAGALLVGAGDGIDVLTNTIAVDVTDFIDTNYGLTENTNNIRINLASPAGLAFSSGALAVADSIAGAGLNISSKVLNVGAGDGIDVAADTVAVDVTDIIGNGLVEEVTNNIALGTPSTLTVSTSNAVTASSHTHAITSSSNPGASASILASDASGYLQLERLGIGVAPSYPLHIRATGSQFRIQYDGGAYPSGTMAVAADGTFTFSATSNLVLAPTGDVYLNPTGDDVLPTNNYDINLGSLSHKYLTLHAAELWVETLVAQDTMATIGGRILVGPTTKLTSDLGSGDTTMYVEHNDLIQGDIAYLEADGNVEFVYINSAAGGVGPYSYTIVRNLDGTGANDWYAGDAVFSTGQSGNGFIDLYSVRGVSAASTAGPTIVGNVRTPQGAENISNTGFESGVDAGSDFGLLLFSGARASGGGSGTWLDWSENAGDGSIADETTQVYAGSHAAKLTSGASSNTYIYQTVSVAAGEIYSLEFWTSGDGTYAGRYGVYDVTHTSYIISATSTGVTGTSFSLIRDTFVIPSGCVSIRVELHVPSTNGGIAYFDDVSLKEMSFNDWVEHWAIGNLNGVYGYGSDTYGVGLGEYSNNYLTIDSTNGIRFFDDTSSLIGQLSGTAWTLGNVSAEHLVVDVDNGIQFYSDSSTVVGQLSSTLWTLGDTTAEHLTISPAEGIYFYDDTGDVLGRVSGTAWIIGKSTSDHIRVIPGGLELRSGTTIRGNWQTDGDIFIGSDISDSSTTYLALFANDATYNGEAIIAGDLLIGDNGGSDNLLSDGDLEDWASASDLTYWTEVDGVAQNSSYQISGTYCAQLTYSATTPQINQTVNVSGDTAYTLGGYIAPAFPATSCTGSYAVYDVTNSTYLVTTTNLVANSWGRKFEASFFTVSSTQSIRVEFNGDNSNSLVYDALYLYEGPYPNFFVDRYNGTLEIRRGTQEFFAFDRNGNVAFGQQFLSDGTVQFTNRGLEIDAQTIYSTLQTRTSFILKNGLYGQDLLWLDGTYSSNGTTTATATILGPSAAANDMYLEFAYDSGASPTQTVSISSGDAANNVSITGFITNSTAQAARASRASAQTISNSTATEVSFTTQDFDTNNMFTPTSTDISIPEDGYYLCVGELTWENPATGNTALSSEESRQLIIQKNSATDLGQTRYVAFNDIAMVHQVHTVAYLVTTDTVNLVCRQLSGGDLDISAAWLAVARIA